MVAQGPAVDPADDRVANPQLSEALAAAARKAGFEAATSDEPLNGAALLSAMGGVRGLLEAVLPGLVFLVVYTFAKDLFWALASSIVLALVFTVLRIVGKTPVMQALIGLVGAVGSAALALWTGRGADNFILGLITNAAYASALLISMLVRWPLIGLAVGYLMGDGVEWRRQRRKLYVLQLVTGCWFALFALRLLVQYPLFLANNIEGLAATKLLMGVPLYAILLIISWLMVRTIYPKKLVTVSSDPR